ncbi:hypothetical protein WMF31_36570 [Sorangium sp. So ce1036]|uniref:hypothetical protein n=1 Tax=Sorangium sp. So ce1036 TaxID=3133328 RepID=UPI003F107AE4
MIPLLTVLAASSAAAQDPAAADVLFNRGVADLEAGRYDTACPALAESQRLDPRPGTLFALADCHDRAGRIATASALYGDYLRAVAQMRPAYRLRHRDRARMATARREALAVEIPELTLVLPASAPQGVRILRDGTEITAASLGMALPLDPGEHVVITQVGGGPVVEQRIVLAPGQKQTVEVQVKAATPEPRIAPRPPAAAPTVTIARPGGAAPAPASVPLPHDEADSGASAQRVGALVVGGVGLAGLALGGVAGAMALSKKSVIEAQCDGTVCTREGKEAADAAKLPGTLSTVGFGVGAAGLAAGVVLWLTAPSPAAGGGARGVSAMVDAGPEGAELVVKGVW